MTLQPNPSYLAGGAGRAMPHHFFAIWARLAVRAAFTGLPPKGCPQIH
jgi:hypothetical protein